MSSIGSVLKLIRVHRDVSQGDMARLFGVTQNFLSQVENGKKDVSIGKLREFAVKLNISNEILLIAGCDTPPELHGDEKKIFLDMKKSAMQIILLDNKQYA